MNSNLPLICMRNVDKTFYTDDTETRALSDIDLDIHKGEYLSISGPSGCGKSTLISLLGLLDIPTRGRYQLAGIGTHELSVPELARIRNREIGFIFQAFNLLGDVNVIENVELPLTYRNGVDKKERRERAFESLERVGMSHRPNHFPSQLSGGQQQRVAVARALVGSPSLILADEPTGNLDSTNGEQVMNLLGELHDNGTTLCMITHDPRYAALSQRQVYLFDGQIVDKEEMDRRRDDDDRRIRDMAGAKKMSSV